MTTSQAKPLPAEPAVLMRPRRILVVDDDAAACELLYEILTAAEVDCLTMTNSRQAAARLVQEKFDAIFLDERMPQLEGVELARLVRATGLNRSTPIVMITGEGDRTLLARAFEAGVNFFLFKPIDRHRILRLIRVRQAVWRGKVQSPKTTNAIRDIPIPFQIVDALKTHIGNRDEGFVFTTKNGTPWNSDLVLKRHLRWKLKVTNGHLHMFRHTFATRQLQAGVPVAVVSKILGHGSISTTLNIYAHVLAEHMEQFERQRARILGTYRAPEAGAVAEERQVA